ncbi:MAG: flagellar hook-associated protein FlgL [Pseudomonadales bacterium]
MRISTSQMHSQSVNQMLDLQRQAADTQNQIASGRKYRTAADDPLGALRVERLNRELAVREQYQRNMDLAESELRLEEASLDQAGNLLQRVRELTVQAGNPVNSVQDRAFIAAEIETRMNELMALMNTRLASGDYLFGGNVGGQPPFVRDAAGAILYQGDEGQRAVQIDGAIRLPVNDSGRRLFVDIPASRTTAVGYAADNPPGGSGALTPPQVVDRAAFEAFPDGGVVIEFQPLGDDPDGLPNFTVRRIGDNRVVGGLENVRFEAGAAVTVAGVEFAIEGSPRAGDRFVVEATDKQGVLSTLDVLIGGLRSLPAGGVGDDAYQELIADSLNNIDNAMGSILEVRSEIGARMGVMDSVRGLHEQVSELSRSVKSGIEDVDFAKAISDLNQQTLVLQAAQQSYVRVSRLSLFDAI